MRDREANNNKNWLLTKRDDTEKRLSIVFIVYEAHDELTTSLINFNLKFSIKKLSCI